MPHKLIDAADLSEIVRQHVGIINRNFFLYLIEKAPAVGYLEDNNGNSINFITNMEDESND